MPEKLRIGLLLNSYNLPKWEVVLIEELMRSNYASIELLLVNSTPPPEKKSVFNRLKKNSSKILYTLYSRFDQKRFRVAPNAFKSVNTRELLSDIAALDILPINKKFSSRFKSEDIARVKEYDLDVLVRFGFGILKGEVLKVARYGIWSYHHGDNLVNRGGPAGFWEVMENWDTTGSILQILSEDLDAGQVLCRSWSQTDKWSVIRNKNKFYWKSLSFLPKKLEELHRLGEREFFDRVAQENWAPDAYSNRLYRVGELHNWKMTKLLFFWLLRYAKDRIANLFYFDQWILLYSFRKNLSTSFWRFKRIVPPRDRFYADPFAVKDGKTHYIFFEEWIYKKNRGHISVMEIDSKGKTTKPVMILDKPYHFSYPYVFKIDDQYYMLPESRANGTIEVYKCRKFPYEWEFHKNLMEGIAAVDATPFFHKGKWWLFTNMVTHPGSASLDELFLFYADDLFSDHWTAHPMNPIVSDVRKSRPAGKLFLKDGRIIRPSQNSSKAYGYGIKLNEIKIMNTEVYVEEEIQSIEPNWDSDIRATHTINNDGRLTIIDGSLRRSRLW